MTDSSTPMATTKRFPPRWRCQLLVEHSRLPTTMVTRDIGADTLMDALHFAAFIARDMTYDDPDQEGSQVATLIALQLK